ncbi:MAG: acetylglucosamine-6-sulfatase, partial [Longimicrobiales bacterium]
MIQAVVATAAAAVLAGPATGARTETPTAASPRETQQAPRNVVLILSDDHRYDLMGFHPNAPEWLETPALDR